MAGKTWTHRYCDLGTTRALWDVVAGPMGRALEEAVELHRLRCGIPHTVTGDGVGKLGNEVHVGGAVRGHEEVDMARPAAGSSYEGLNLREAESGAVDTEDPDEVRTEVWYENEGAGGVGKDLMRVRGLLSRGNGAWFSKRECLGVDQGEAGMVEVVEPSDRGASAAAGWRSVSWGNS